MSALSNRRWVGRYDAPYEMTSYGIGEVIGKTRTNVEKTLKELIADGLVEREKRHVQEFSGRKVWAYQITPEGQRACNNGMFSDNLSAEGRYRVGSGQGGYSYTPLEEACSVCGINEENVLMIYRDDGTIELACKRGDCDMHMVLSKPRPRSGFLSKLKNFFSAEEEEREFCNWCKETLSETRPEARANGEQVCQPCYEAWMEEYRNDLDMHYSPFYAETVVKEAQFKPPASAISNAKRGLKLRKEYGRGGLSPSEAAAQGIDSGVTRAKRIASGTVSTHDVRRMSAFNRHRKNYRPEKKMPDGGPTAGTIAWLLWGGTSGVNWAKKKSAAMNAEEKLSKTSCCCGATEANPCACMKSAQPMKCSAIEPMCPCYAAKSAETFEAYDVASWNPADEPTEEEAVWEQFYEYCPDNELVAKLWDLEGQPGDSAESWMDNLEGTDEHENVFERHYQLIKKAAFDWWSKMYDAEDETIKVSPFRKAKVLDIIIDWHQRNQMQSETIAYNLDRIHWLLENPDQDWEDYDDLTEDDFSAETRPDVVTDGCPVCETELSEVSDTVLRCDRCEIAVGP